MMFLIEVDYYREPFQQSFLFDIILEDMHHWGMLLPDTFIVFHHRDF